MAMKTQRQPRCSVTAPAARGPTTEGITQLAAKAAMIEGRSRSGVGAADDDVQRDDDEPAAEPLHRAPGHEDPHRGRRTGEQQSGREGGDPGGEGPQRPVPVGPLAGEDHREERGGEVRGEREGVERDAVQLPRGDGHRGADGGRLEGDEQDDGDDADAQRPVRAAEDPAVRGREVPSGRSGDATSASRGSRAVMAVSKGRSRMNPVGGRAGPGPLVVLPMNGVWQSRCGPPAAFEAPVARAYGRRPIGSGTNEPFR